MRECSLKSRLTTLRIVVAIRHLWLFACLPLYGQNFLDQRSFFEENRGQLRTGVRYVMRPGVYFTDNGLGTSIDRFYLQFENASSSAHWVPSNPLPGPLNIYFGSDPSKWITGMPRYGTIQLSGVYPGIDISFSPSAPYPLSFRITLAPGADPGNIRVSVAGGTLSVSGSNGSVVNSTIKEISESFTIVYAGAQFVQIDSTHFGIQLANYDPSLTTQINLVFGGTASQSNQYATYTDAPYIVGPSNALYHVGSVPRVITEQSGADSCTPSYDAGAPLSTPCVDAMFIKYSPTGQVAYTSYFTGSGQQDAGRVQAAITPGAFLGRPIESVFLAGTTSSPDFPTTPGALQRNYGGANQPRPSIYAFDPLGDLFIARIDGDSGNLVYCTLLGSPQIEDLWDLHVSTTGDGAVFVTGAGGTLAATPGAYLTQGIAAEGDIFVAKINGQGSRLLYLTYLPVLPEAVDIGPDNGFYFVGESPPGFPTTPGAYQTQPTAPAAGESTVVAKLNPAGTGFDYATYFTDFGSEFGDAIAVDSGGNAWFSTEVYLKGCCLLAKINAAGSEILYAGPFVDQGQYGPNSLFLFQDQLINLSAYPISGMPPVGFNCGSQYITKLDRNGTIIREESVPWGGPIGVDSAGNLVFLDSSLGLQLIRVDMTASSSAGPSCILNAASFRRPYAVAPGEIVTIGGYGIGPSVGTTDPSLEPRVLFNGEPATVLYAQSNQVNAIAPFSLQPGNSLLVEVEYQGQKLPGLSTWAATEEPDFFTLNGTGGGQALAFNQDGTPNSDSNPAAVGSIVTAFLNGTGATGVTSSTISLGGPSVDVVYMGPSPGSLPSITQVNFRVPQGFSPGTYRLALTIDFVSQPLPFIVVTSPSAGSARSLAGGVVTGIDDDGQADRGNCAVHAYLRCHD